MPAPAATGALDDAVAAFKPLARGGLEATLERLEATAADAMARWTSSDGFAKVLIALLTSASLWERTLGTTVDTSLPLPVVC